MGKKEKSQSKNVPQSGKAKSSLSFLGGNTSIDPALASLFEQSSGPVKEPVISTTSTQEKDEIEEEQEVENDEEISELEDEPTSEDEAMQDAPKEASDESTLAVEASEAPSKKRKRGAVVDDLEESYMRRIAKEEQKEEEKRRAEKAKRQKVEEGGDDDHTSADQSEDDEEGISEEDEEIVIPKHETQHGEVESNEIEKSSRTVFLGNVSSEAIKSKSAKKTLLKHLASFLSTLPESTGPHKVESIRFRSTAFASGGHLPKRASFARREILNETTPSTNAYVVYSSTQAARKAPSALNGTIVLDRHLRVDSVAHPSQVDNKRCIFVGNLDFIDNEVNPDDDQKKKKKNSVPADVEEGLWRTFNTHIKGSKETSSSKGNVESVRVIRDSSTRVGKGFAYVQFYDQNCVEEALLLNGKKFPPLLPRILRIMRAKKIIKKRESGPGTGANAKSLGEAYTTLQGRAGRLFGKAGASKLKDEQRKSISSNSVVFEGHRATEGGSRIKVKTKSRGSKGKPNNRSSKRAAAYQAAGGRKGKMGN